MKAELAYYLALPYERVWQNRDDDGEYFLVSLREIPEVRGWGYTESEAEAYLVMAFEDYLTWCLQEQLPIPEPATGIAPTGS